FGCICHTPDNLRFNTSNLGIKTNNIKKSPDGYVIILQAANANITIEFMCDTRVNSIGYCMLIIWLRLLKVGNSFPSPVILAFRHNSSDARKGGPKNIDRKCQVQNYVKVGRKDRKSVV